MPSVKEELHRKVNTDHAMTLSDIGFQKLQEKNYNSAKNYFLEALTIDPESPYALMNLGVICEQEGDIEQAVNYYQQVLANGTDEEFGAEGEDSVQSNIRALCRENIRRLLDKEQDSWPYEKEDE
jgi:general secretion pathway protein D